VWVKKLSHGLGHALGVQVHDVGCRPRDPAANNPYLRHTASIEPGQVFTIEPGCYFIDSLLEPLREAPAGSAIDWNAVAELRPFGGVRIEDNIAVIADGSRNLTRDNSRNPP
jgi:Xaa-Pro dipeptidase